MNKHCMNFQCLEAIFFEDMMRVSESTPLGGRARNEKALTTILNITQRKDATTCHHAPIILRKASAAQKSSLQTKGQQYGAQQDHIISSLATYQRPRL